MPSLAEVLKAAGIKDEVIAGLPKDVVAAADGHVASADTKLAEAKEALRQAGLTQQEINEYVEKYGTALTEMAGVKAENEAFKATLKSLKDQGFDIKIPGADSGAPVVPGSPARGANSSDFDPQKFSSDLQDRVGNVMGTFLDANNKHMILFGTPIPDSALALGQEASKARKPLGEYIAEKYKFAAKEAEKQQADFDKKVADAVKAKVEEQRRAEAEAGGSNPNLRPGVPSRNSVVKVNHDEFQKSSGNVPSRERRERMISNIRRDVESARQSA